MRTTSLIFVHKNPCPDLAVCFIINYFIHHFHDWLSVLIQVTNHQQADSQLTHWGRVTYICVSKLTIIGSDNGLLPDRRQAIIWTNAGLLIIGPLGTNFSENLIEILIFSFKKMRLKMLSAKRQPFCLGLNVLKWNPVIFHTRASRYYPQPCT